LNPSPFSLPAGRQALPGGERIFLLGVRKERSRLGKEAYPKMARSEGQGRGDLKRENGEV